MGADSVGYAPGELISGSKFTMAMSRRISVSCSINCNTVSLRAGVETPQATHARMWSYIGACPELRERAPQTRATAPTPQRSVPFGTTATAPAAAHASPATSPDPPLHHHRHPARRRDRDRAQDGPHAVAGREPEVDAREHLGEHGLQLVGREGRPQAAPDAAAEREEGVGARARPEEALGLEALGVRPEVGPVVRP